MKLFKKIYNCLFNYQIVKKEFSPSKEFLYITYDVGILRKLKRQPKYIILSNNRGTYFCTNIINDSKINKYIEVYCRMGD